MKIMSATTSIVHIEYFDPEWERSGYFFFELKWENEINEFHFFFHSIEGIIFLWNFLFLGAWGGWQLARILFQTEREKREKNGRFVLLTLWLSSKCIPRMAHVASHSPWNTLTSNWTLNRNDSITHRMQNQYFYFNWILDELLVR